MIPEKQIPTTAFVVEKPGAPFVLQNLGLKGDVLQVLQELPPPPPFPHKTSAASFGISQNMYFPIKKKVDLEIYRNSRPKFCGEMGGVGEVPEVLDGKIHIFSDFA
jgi:hypothetical protein